jgi:hypothetical protein
VEPLNLVIRRYERVIKSAKRYSPPNFHSTFVLSSTDDEPKLIREDVDLTNGKI